MKTKTLPFSRRPAPVFPFALARLRPVLLALLVAVAAPAQDFQINSLTANNALVTEVNSLTGDDRGGIAASGSRVFLTGDASTARLNRADLSSGAPLGAVRDGLVSDLKTETVYLLANGTTPLAPYNVAGTFTVNSLVRLDGLTGQPDGTVISLSAPITVPGNDSSTVGIFAGWGRAVIHNGTRVYEISLPSGAVIDLGALPVPQRTASESWAYWGVAETIGGLNHLAYVRNSTTIARTRVSDGTVTTVASFSNLGDMASFTVVPSLNRWYFHHESGSQFGSFAEALGFADATLTTPANPPVISSQPQSVMVIATEPAAFSVSANGTQPLAYQWRRAGVDIIDATNSTYSIASTVVADAGSYSVVITNVHGSVTSDAAVLTLEAVTADLFKIASLRTNNFLIVDPLNAAGDDRGGLVASDSHVFLRGDDSVGSFNITNLGSAVRLGTNDGALTVFFKYDSLISDLRSQKVYVLGNGSTVITETGGTATTLIEIHGSNGVPVGSPITLSSSIALGAGGLYTANVGLFSGWGRLVIHNGTAVYSIDPASGTVTSLGAMARPTRAVSESWAYWGVAEYWGGSVRLVYARDAQSIVRASVPGGATEAVGSFANLNDLASFTVVPGMNRWYFHNETVNQFSTYNNYGGEVLGYADASFIYQAPPVSGVAFSASTVSVLEDSGAASVAGLVTNAPGGTVSFSVANSSNSLFIVQPAVSPAGMLTFTPAANANGSATVTVTALDGGGSSLGSGTFTLTVVPVNDPPVPAFATNSIVVLEDSGVFYWTNFAAATTGPVNEGGQAIINFTTSNDNNPLFGILPDIGLDGTLRLAPTANAHGTAIVTIVTQDDGGQANGGMDSVTNTLTVTVVAVNDAPTVTLTSANVVVAEDSGAYSANIFASTSVGPANEVTAPQAITNVTILSVTNPGLFASGPTLAMDGTLAFTPAANAYGTALVTFTAQDNGGTDNGGVDKTTNTFLITVTAVNDAPGFSLAPSGREGRVVAWGLNSDGQTTVPNPPLLAVAVCAKGNRTLALKSDGTVVAWGLNNHGQGEVPLGLSGVVAVSAGDDHNLALKSDGTVVAWGRNHVGQTDVPPGLAGVVAISAGSLHSLALRSDGTVTAWGGNNYGQGVVPPGLTGVAAISAGSRFNLALLNNGTVVAWGDNAYHETEVPAGLSGVVAIAAGAEHALALKADGTVVAWGRNTFGSSNDGTGLSEVPVGLAGVVAIAANGEHNLALKSDGTVVAWGRNEEGQTNVPLGLGGVIAVSAGFYHSAVLADATGSPQLTVLEDSGLQTVPGMARNISVGSPQESAQQVSFTVTNDNNALFLVQPAVAANGTLTFTPAANANGSAIVTVIAVDDGGLPGVDTSAPQTFTITVTPVNDAPSFNLSSTNVTVFPGDGGVVVRPNWVANLSAGPANEAGQTVTIERTNSSPAMFIDQPVLLANGTLEFTPEPTASGVVTVGVRVVDNGGTTNGGADTSGWQLFTITFAPVKVFVSDSPVVISGTTVEVPICLAGVGTEGAVSFTLTYDRPTLSFQSAAVEAGSGLSLTWTEPYPSLNKVGIIVTKPAGSNFTAGTNVLVRMTFQAPIGTAPTNTPLGFSSATVMQQVSDTNANVVTPVLYVPGSVTIIAVPPLEGDVAPRNAGGNGAVTVSDAVQITRFVAGWDAITDFAANGEFQRADCAPRGTLGDGRVTLIDLVQTLRYAAGLDPATSAGGPTVQAASLAASSARVAAGTRVVRVVGGNLLAGRANTVSVQLDAQGNEAGVSLSLGFDPTAMTFV
ncbi:MAG: Ig-like domain-containing protein, partial [Limisphaerales bacterium]